MYGDYRLFNRKTKSDWNLILILEEMFDAIRFYRDFSTNSHCLREIDHNGKDQLYHWKFISFGLKNAYVEF
jgi:hypothetical protein